MPEIVERGPRVRALGVEPRQLRHDDERHLPLERQRLEALQHEGRIFVLRRAGHAARRRDELEVVDSHQPELPQWVEALRRRLEVRGRERQDREGEVAQPHGGSADAGARLIIELGAAQLVHGRASFDREGALHQALLVHLSGEEGHAGPLLRRAQRQSEGERGLARPDVAAQHHEVATSQAPTQNPVDRGEPGRDGVARDVTRALLIHALDHGLERRTLGKAAGGPTSLDVDGPTGLQRSRRLPPPDPAPRTPARPTGTAPGPRQPVWRGRGGGARGAGGGFEGPGGGGARGRGGGPAGAADGSCPTRGAAAGAPRRSARRATARIGPPAWVPGRRPRPTRSSAPPRQWSPGSRDEALHRGGHLFGGDVRKRSEEHTSELQSRLHLVCRLLLEKKKNAYAHTRRLLISLA